MLLQFLVRNVPIVVPGDSNHWEQPAAISEAPDFLIIGIIKALPPALVLLNIFILFTALKYTGSMQKNKHTYSNLLDLL